MNKMTVIDKPSTDLIIVETLKAEVVFVPGGVDKIISEIEAKVRAVKTDISTKTGRAEISSLAYKIARSKTALDDMGKDLVADMKRRAGVIDAERRTVAAADARVEAEAKAERERVAAEAKAAEEAQAAADRAAVEQRRVEQERVAAVARAEQAEADRIAAAAQAEQDRLAAAEQAERDRAAAIEAERKRVADAKATEDAATAKREADERHRATIDGEAAGALRQWLGPEATKEVIAAIASGKVPHVTIRY